MTTPYGLNTANPVVRDALGDAIRQLSQAHLPLDAALGAVQYVSYHGRACRSRAGPATPTGSST